MCIRKSKTNFFIAFLRFFVYATRIMEVNRSTIYTSEEVVITANSAPFRTYESDLTDQEKGEFKRVMKTFLMKPSKHVTWGQYMEDGGKATKRCISEWHSNFITCTISNKRIDVGYTIPETDNIPLNCRIALLKIEPQS